MVRPFGFKQSDLADAHLIRGRALKRIGRTDESLVSLRTAVLLGPESPEMHQTLGEPLAESGRSARGWGISKTPPGRPG